MYIHVDLLVCMNKKDIFTIQTRIYMYNDFCSELEPWQNEIYCKNEFVNCGTTVCPEKKEIFLKIYQNHKINVGCYTVMHERIYIKRMCLGKGLGVSVQLKKF